jgi:hypothetical protein
VHRTLCGLLLAGFACFAQPGGPISSADRAKITALSKTFLRDSAELPMDVAVQTIVTDASGNPKRRAQSTVRFLFHGYNQQAGSFQFEARGSWFNGGPMHDSLAGDFAVLDALRRLAPNAKRSPGDEPVIHPDPSGKGFLVRAVQQDCDPFETNERFLYPTHYCTSVEVRITNGPDGALAIESFSLDMRNLPAPAKIPYLGAVQLKRFRAEGDIQKAWLPNDPSPFFVPKRVVTTIDTDKGRIVVTNAYTLSKKK